MAAAAPLLIQVGVAASVSLASKFLAPKPKLSPVDKGRFDDIRFQTAEEGAFIPLCFGKRVRLAGNMIWGTVTKEYVTRSPGRSVGKGGTPEPPTPPTNAFTYKKSFALLVCGTPVRSYRRISENLEVVYSNLGSELQEDFYEAENHTPGSGATVVIDGQCSAGRAVRLAGSSQYVEIAVAAQQVGLYSVVIFYKAAGASSVYLSANGGAETLVSLPAAATVPLTVTATLALRRGANTIKLRGGSGTVDVDRIYISATGSLPPPPPGDPPDPPIGPGFPDRGVTHLIDLDATYPSDLDNPTPYYNTVQGFDANGYFEGYMTAGGQARFELFAGKETQPQSAIIVAVEGAGETPAWRDASFFATEDYLVQGGQLGNFIFEIEPDIQNLDEALLYLYTLDGKVMPADCDFSALAGVPISGLVLDHRAPLEEWVAALETWFNFDIVPRGGKIAAVPRGGAVVTRIYERELRAHLFGEQRPRGAVKITHDDPIDLPGMVDVLYLDPAPSKDFHTGNQTAEKTVGFAFDKDTLSFPIVGDPDTAHAVGLRYLDARHLAAKSGEIVCGFGKRHLIPTDIIEVEMESGTLHTYRVTQKQADLQSMVKFGVVPERASVYTQTGAGTRGRGGDIIIIRPPANSILAQADIPPLRTAERGRLGRYMGGCGRAGGAWHGAGLYKKTDADEWARVTSFNTEATTGVALTALPDWTDPNADDTTSTLDVGLFNGSLESITAPEFAGNSELNVLIVAKPDGTGETLRFQVATPLTVNAGEPYESKYRLSTFKRGFNHTAHAMTGHTAGDVVLLPDTAVKFIEEPVEEIDRARDWTLVSSGQALADSPVKNSTLHGYSYRPAEVQRFTGQRNAGTNDIFLDWIPFEAGELQEYVLRFYGPGDTKPRRAFTLKTAGTEPLMMTRDDLLTDGTPATSFGDCSSVTSVATDGTYTVSSNGSASTVCNYISQELRGDCIIQFEADTRSTPAIVGIIGAAPRPCVIDPVADTVRIPGNDLELYVGQQIAFRTVGGTLPGGTVANAGYYIVDLLDADTFQVSDTAEGSPIDLTSAGSGVLADVDSGLALITTETPTTADDPVFIMPAQASLFKKRAIPRESYAIEMNGRQARYFVPFTGDTRSPVFTSGSFLSPNPFRVRCGIGPFGGSPLNRPEALVRPRVIYRKPNAFTYSRDKQNADFHNAPPALIIVEIRQVGYIGNTRVEGLAKYIEV
jgi:hypothetical protein